MNGFCLLILSLLFPFFTICLYSQDSTSWVLNGSEKLIAGNYEGALLDFNKAIELNPNDADAYYYIAETMMKKDDRQEAMKNYNKAISIKNDHIRALKNRGKLKAFMGDLNGSVADFNRAIKINPAYSDAYFNRGLTLFYLKKYKEAIDDYTKVISINGNDHEAYYQRGRAKYDSGDKDGGCADWSKAGELGYFEAYAKIKNYCNK
ncbi:MAG: tetratricopeptide repeat protein [Bacteroidetes bacterium]|nr:tetratricopeptide repeat protein [Bacteroidota bacterium]